MIQGSRKLAAVSLLVVAPAAITLVWLGLKLLDQDRVLKSKSEAERRVVTTEKVAHALQIRLSSSLDDPEFRPLTLRVPPFSAEERKHLLWIPGEKSHVSSEAPVFAESEKNEYRGNLETALAQYAVLARSEDESTKAGALLRQARIHRQRREWDSALARLSEVAKIPNAEFNGRPVSLEARSATCSLLSEAGRKESLAETANRLEADFIGGAWSLDRNTWEFTRGDITRWTGREIHPSRADWLLTLAAEQIHEDIPGLRAGIHTRVVVVEGELVTVVERRNDQGIQAALLLPDAVREWVREIDVDDVVSVVAEDGHTVAGKPPTDDRNTVIRRASETGLPWTLSVTSAQAASSDLTSRTHLLEIGLAAIVVLLAGGGYLFFRVIQQELAVARLQTEFVAAVSHEFRTPLASLRHVTELLSENDDFTPQERERAYSTLGRNTERLSRLVESLLDFARMEGGRKPYQLEPVDAVSLATTIVETFRLEAEPQGFSLELETPPEPVMVEADPESLSQALSNLLENAVKYSPGGDRVLVTVTAGPGTITIGVRDEGLGIPQKEQKEIFKKFIRGAKARELGIKGTGLGLAMVARIVEAHRGKVELESKEGAGSTFRVTLPAA